VKDKEEKPKTSETPPRMWGRRASSKRALFENRNTPTHVGKTKSKRTNAKSIKKHPHACGEDAKIATS